ncbi:MAG: response regulator transcription factor [Lachnospiraceae bacterium]|nr:response regulator transcription factor [Lachnospiraceae bacterium]
MIRVLIAEDIEPVLKRYGRILGTDPEIEVVGQVQTGEAAVKESLLFHPDVILMDVEMETRTAGLDASRQILAQTLPTPKIIILTVYEDDETVFEAFRLGVTDYVLKNSPPEEIIGCVRDAYLNRSPIRPAIARKIRDEFQRIKKQEDSLLYCIQIVSQLTQTELDILTLMSRGYTRSQICEIRCVELSTVKSQIHTILKKFGKNNMQELIAMLNHLHVLEYLHLR